MSKCFCHDGSGDCGRDGDWSQREARAGQVVAATDYQVLAPDPSTFVGVGLLSSRRQQADPGTRQGLQIGRQHLVVRSSHNLTGPCSLCEPITIPTAIARTIVAKNTLTFIAVLPE